MNERMTISSFTGHKTPHQGREAHARTPSYQGCTLMLLSEIIASVGHVEPLFVGQDGFPELESDPLHLVQHTLSSYIAEMTDDEREVSLADSTHAHTILHASASQRGDAVCAILTRQRWIATQTHFLREKRSGALIALLERVLAREVTYRQELLVETLHGVGAMAHLCGHELPWGALLRSIEEHLGTQTLGTSVLQGLAAMRSGELLARRTLIDRDQHLLRIEKMLAGCQEMHVELGAAWSDAMHHELEAMEDAHRAEWDALLTHLTQLSNKPSKRWLKRTRACIDRIGESHVRGALLRWLPGFGKRATMDFDGCSRHDPLSSIPSPRNEDMLRGLAALSSLLGGETLSAVIGDMALASYQKITGHGPRSVRVGNMCIWALGHMPEMACLGQLWRLRQKLSYATADRQIENMIKAAAERFMIELDDLEELAVPTFGMDARGRLEEEVGDWRFELELDGTRQVNTRWVRQSVNGQGQLFALLQDEEVSHTLPRSLMRENPTQSARLEALPKEIEKMLQAQSERLEAMYWQARTWTYDLWIERYLEHPLLSVLCKDLIWSFGLPDASIITAMPYRGALCDAHGRVIEASRLHDARVELWHPVNASPSEVEAWRRFLLEHRITQPFKQAYREIFDLASEQEGDVGVLRLPGYVLKQHQFVALCKARGWQARLQGSWQTPQMPERVLGEDVGSSPRAQLWVSAVSAPSLMTRAGAYIYVVMEQLVFTEPGGLMCALEQVDPVVYSELWRDLELFASVAGVHASQVDEVLRGALDSRGVCEDVPELRLSGAVRVRGEVLEAMMEHVAWGERCEVVDQQFWVEGSDGTRRAIELATGVIRDASGAMLDSATWVGDGLSDRRLAEQVCLPFEGDGLLWTILRKAYYMTSTRHASKQVAG